jgi:hypothetical protein
MPGRHAQKVVSRVSRRTLMKTGAGVGIAAAVGYAGVAFAGPPSGSAADAKPTGTGRGAVDGPLVVHVIDASAGTVEVFTGSARKQIKDHDLVARIARAARG